MLIKIPDINGLVTTTILNTKIGEVENKIPSASGLVTATVLNTKNKIHDHAQYITTREFDKFAATTSDTK